MMTDNLPKWRPMRPDDLFAVSTISDTVHRQFREDEATYAERLALYPTGCMTLEQDGAIAGFIISHPWHRDQTPGLNERLGAIPADSDTYYLHDIALLPSTRGHGAGKAAADHVIAHARARGFVDVTLVAVNGADSFWARQGFVIAGDSESSPYGPGTCLMRRSVAES